jgi:thiol-disulfide isomerase/thioredoxin
VLTLLPNLAILFVLGVVPIPVAAAVGEAPAFQDRFGIGAAFVQHDSTSAIVINGCLPRSPASQAGLEPGDTLIALDDEPVAGWVVPQVSEYLLVDRPAPVAVTVRRGAVEVTVHLQRARMSSILAAAGLKADSDSTGTTFVPLHEVDPLRPREQAPVLEVHDAGCMAVNLTWDARVPTLLYFWATWCSPCKFLIRELQSMRAGESDRVRLIGFNLDRDCTKFAAAVAELQPPGRQVWDGDSHGHTAQLFRTYRGIPLAVLIEPGGTIARFAVGVDSILALLNPRMLQSAGTQRK